MISQAGKICYKQGRQNENAVEGTEKEVPEVGAFVGVW